MLTRNAAMVLNGELTWTDDLMRIVRGADLVIGVDGGSEHLAKVDIKPDRVIGDLDSIGESTRAWVGAENLIHRPIQDETDFEKALMWTVGDAMVQKVVVLGALGGAMDHSINNLGIVARRAMGHDLVLVCKNERILATAAPIDLDARRGEKWSFWTFDPGVRVTVKGVRWPLDNAPLDAGGRPSISNVASSDRIRVEPVGGSVIIDRHLD